MRDTLTVDAMGILHTEIAFENPAARGRASAPLRALVDTGAELSWAPAALLESLGIARVKRDTFQMADGALITRDIGYAIVHVAGRETNDEVVFAEGEDLVLLGARSVEGLNVKIDLVGQRFVSAGPMPATGNIRVRQ
jgi:predicted aspartyl protease